MPPPLAVLPLFPFSRDLSIIGRVESRVVFPSLAERAILDSRRRRVGLLTYLNVAGRRFNRDSDSRSPPFSYL